MYRLKDGCVLPEGFMPAKISSFVCISMTHLTSNHFAVFKFFYRDFIFTEVVTFEVFMKVQSYWEEIDINYEDPDNNHIIAAMLAFVAEELLLK
jgi:hypothetical protein